MPGRPPKPAKLLELNGSVAHDKKRYAARAAAAAKRAAEAGEIGPPPEHWKEPSSYPSGSRERIWQEYVGMFPSGLLTREHRAQLEQLCIATSESRRPGKYQLRWSSEVTKILRLFGMNPLDRERVTLRGKRQPLGPQAVGSNLAQFVLRKKAG